MFLRIFDWRSSDVHAHVGHELEDSLLPHGPCVQGRIRGSVRAPIVASTQRVSSCDFSYMHHMNRQKPIYERARISFEEVIRPNARTAALIRAAREEVLSILSQPKPPPATSADGERRSDSTLPKPALYIGVHVRKGDWIPGAYPFYPGNKIPLQKYIEGARTAWDKFYGNTTAAASTTSEADFEDVGDHSSDHDVSSGHDDHFPAPPLMWLASDSPPASREFISAFPTATAVFSLAHSTNSELRALAPVHEYVQAEFDKESLEERVRLTRGMIVDLAMVSGLWSWPGEVVPGAVVCGEGYVTDRGFLMLCAMVDGLTQVERMPDGGAWVRLRPRVWVR